MFPLKAATFLFVIALFFGVVSMERGVDEQTGHAWVKFSVSDHGLEKARGLLLQLADAVQAMRERPSAPTESLARAPLEARGEPRIPR
jgi:hypothetical protein